jgi:hypothetical protein
MKNAFIILSILFVISGAWITYKSYDYGKTYKEEKTEYVKVLNFEERLLQAKERLRVNNIFKQLKMPTIIYW